MQLIKDQRKSTLFKYVFPTILSNVCFFLFTIVDGIFVGNGVGTDALGAINIAYPFCMIGISLFNLTTIGGATTAAIRFGRGDKAGANKAFMHSLTATAIIGIILCLTGVLIPEKLAVLMGATDTFIPMVRDYILWYCVFAIPSGLLLCLNAFGRNDGAPGLVSANVIIATALNIFGDWLFVFPMQMGIKGAAIATGISETICFFIILSHFLRKKGDLRITRYSFNKTLLGKVLVRGIPESVAQFAFPIATIVTNWVLADYIGDIGVNAFSIICYVGSFSAAVFLGTAQGLQPLFGRTYGQKNNTDLKFYLHAGIIINLIGSIAITILLYFVSSPICALFGADAETLDFTIRYMPYYTWGFVITSLNTIYSAYLYSTKRTKEAIIINVLRSFIIDSAVIILLPMFFGSTIIWATMGIYEAVIFIITIIMVWYSEKDGVVFY